jgi:hypothetical protein
MPQPSHPLTAQRRMATVTALVAGPPPLVTVQLGGDDGTSAPAGDPQSLPYDSGYVSPMVGDTVAVLSVGGDHYVLGVPSWVVPSRWVGLSYNAAKFGDYGAPYALGAYRKDNGIVRLRGLTKTNAANVTTGTTIATLPVGFRPAANNQQDFSVTVSTAAVASVRIDDAGVLNYQGLSTIIGAGTFLSLSGITWLAEQ